MNIFFLFFNIVLCIKVCCIYVIYMYLLLIYIYILILLYSYELCIELLEWLDDCGNFLYYMCILIFFV